jgi:glycerol-3-phosphate dehydrogenase
MSGLNRDIQSASKHNYDVIIIGGGIYGAMLLFTASLQGLRSLLVEKSDFGGETSFNSLRIIHGGIRYLQNLNIKRTLESVKERAWFLRTFPEHVVPMPCLMPLYNKGFRRSSIFRAALLFNEFLSFNRNSGVGSNRKISSGRVVNADKVKKIFPAVDPDELKGGAVWYDALMPDSQRLLIDILRLSSRYGAICLNYVEARHLLTVGSRANGIHALDHIGGRHYDFKADIVINAAGPWCRELAAKFDHDEPSLFKSSLAWNVVLNRQALSDHAVAVAPKRPGGPTYFIVPWKKRMFVGTGHAPWSGKGKVPIPTIKQLQEFIDDINLALPSLRIELSDILRVFPGLQSATETGGIKLATHEIIYDHAKHGGPVGFFSISGVKFTTSHLVAEKIFSKILKPRGVFKKKIFSIQKEDRPDRHKCMDISWFCNGKNNDLKKELKRIIDEEAVVHLDDLVLRRTCLWESPQKVLEIAPLLYEFFGWDVSRSSIELKRLKENLIF